MRRAAALLLLVACASPPLSDAGTSGDAGTMRDAGAANDAGAPDAGTAPADAGTPPADAGGAPPDAGSLPPDAGSPPQDAGSSPPDAGPVVVPYTCPSGAAEAFFVSEVVPPSTMTPYDVAQTTVTFANCGAQTWNATAAGAPNGYKLGFDSPRDDDTWGASRVALGADVPPGSAITVPLSIRATPLTGSHGYQWAIVQEGVAWLDAPSPLHAIDVEAVSALAAICPGVQADIGGGAPASAALQQCVDATPSGGTLEIPAGVYQMTSLLDLTHPMTLRTVGTVGVAAGCLDANGPACAVFRADDNLSLTSRGFVRFDSTSGVTLEHVVIDGNRQRRVGGPAAAQCAAGNNGYGINAGTGGCTGCSFVWGVSARSVCGSGWEWSSDQATIANCVFRENGDHTTQNMWSDGLTLNQSNGATVTSNRMIDNSDVDLIFGGGTNATVSGNLVLHLSQASFAGLMLDNFNASTSGDFTGTQVTANTVNCGAQLCDFAIELGPHPWYVSANLIGGTVSGNTAVGGKIDLQAEGAGTAAAPMVVTGNTAGAVPGTSATFQCGSRAVTAFNVSPDSVVDLQGGPQPTASFQFHLCP